MEANLITGSDGNGKADTTGSLEECGKGGGGNRNGARRPGGLGSDPEDSEERRDRKVSEPVSFHDRRVVRQSVVCLRNRLPRLGHYRRGDEVGPRRAGQGFF